MPTKISFYKNVKQTESQDAIDIELLLDGIQSGKWQDEVLKIRNMKDEAQRRAAKALLPNVTLSGLFGKRQDNDCKIPSDLIGIDLDGLGKEVEAVKALLSQDPYVFACFVSAGGKGLCPIFKIDPEKHREAFEGIANYLLTNYQLVVDPTGINPSRTRFVSYDPHLYIADSSITFKKYLPKPKVRKITSQIFVQDEFDRVVNEMVQANVSCVEDYRDWRDVAFGLADQFGEGGRNYFHRLSSCSAKYESSMTDRQYTHALKRNGKVSNKITIATIYWFAKQAGINVSSERTRKIAAATSTMKKSGLNAKTIAENLEKFDGITGAEGIIQQAFSSNANFEKNESMVENVRMWLRHNYNLKRNEVSRKIENNGKIQIEIDFNQMFLDAKVIFDKLSFDLFMKIVFSYNTPSFNPVKDLIESIEWDGKERLSNIGGAITSDTGTLQWRCLMVRKWIVGIITSVYGGVNELDFILVGGKNTGKTQFFKRLLPEEFKTYFALSQLNRGKDDEILMCEKLIILNDEYGGKNKLDERNEKRLMAADRFDLRVPYGKGNETVIRIASLCGTCNDISVLDDATGNRRIIIMEATGRFNYELYNSIDKCQLLAEALAAYKKGERPELTDEDILTLETNTDGRYSKVSIEGEMISKYFELPEKCLDVDFMTATEIKLYLDFFASMNLNVNKIGAQLKKLGYKRVGKNQRYGYEIRKIPPKNDSCNNTKLHEPDPPF